MNTENNDPKKTIENLSNDQVSGENVKGGGGPFGPPPPGAELGDNTPLPGAELDGPPPPGAELDGWGGDGGPPPMPDPHGPMNPPGPMIPPPPTTV